MNASCALQHFCDLHGPQILLCTESRTYVQDSNDNDEEDLKAFYSQYIKSENPQGKVECKVNKTTLKKNFFLIIILCFSLVHYHLIMLLFQRLIH
jgi:hypothetical protein